MAAFSHKPSSSLFLMDTRLDVDCCFCFWPPPNKFSDGRVFRGCFTDRAVWRKAALTGLGPGGPTSDVRVGLMTKLTLLAWRSMLRFSSSPRSSGPAFAGSMGPGRRARTAATRERARGATPGRAAAPASTAQSPGCPTARTTLRRAAKQVILGQSTLTTLRRETVWQTAR